MPPLLPTREEWRVLQCMRFPIDRYDSIGNLLAFVRFQRGNNDVLCVPGVLILHDAPLALFQHLQNERRHVWLLAEVLDWREERLEVEDHGSR